MNSVKEYTCPNCKAGLEFNPESQKWKCNYCFSEFNENEVDATYEEKKGPSQEPTGDLNSYSCTSCGAELIADDTIAATFCIYCNSHSIIKSRFSGQFTPKSVIPFKVGKKEAREIYTKWISKKKFAPKDFKDKKELEKITGIYVPFWIFDNNVKGQLNGEGTKVHTWSDMDYEYTQTKYYRILRECIADYNGVPIDGLKKLDDSLMIGIEPYNYNELTGFSMKYMTGFMAEKYDVDVKEASVVTNERVKQYMSSRLSQTVTGYSNFTQNSTKVTITNMEYSYAMLPIYLLVNEYEGKKYEFIINGQTGKIIGDAPIDRTSQIKFALLIFIISWLIYVFGGALIV
ncbi:DNA helicase PriA [Clostridium sp. UBA1056]|uniref:DNA helicase PriA n=1 Tax=unclassified Clostridium TaxID=2614128 RepID=UPI003217F6E5